MLAKVGYRLSYSNVIATLAIFRAIVTKKVRDAAITEAKIADGAVTGAKANLATFGQDPSAASADNALALGGKTAAQLQTVSGFDQNETDVPFPVATAPINSVTVTTPDAARILASASLIVRGDGGGDFASTQAGTSPR